MNILNKFSVKISQCLGLIAFVALIGCTEEEKYDFPIVQTGDVVEITESGAVFHGKIMNQGNEEIIDHGFVWDTIPDLSINGNNYIKSLGKYGSSLFSAKISSVLVKNQGYYVKSYIQFEDYTIYGRTVDFNSLGSHSPIIKDFNPKVATWGDTLIIQGSNFSNRKNENFVSIGNYVLNVISETDSLINAILPSELNSQNVPIKISILKENSELNGLSKDNFKLKTALISSYSPEVGDRDTEISILGDNFHALPNLNNVFLGKVRLEIIEADQNHIRVKIPYGVTHGENDLSLIIAGLEYKISSSFMVFEPWSEVSNIGTEGRKLAFSFTIGDSGYVGGGYGQDGQLLDDLWKFDTSNDTWTQKTSIPFDFLTGLSFSVKNSTSGYFLKSKTLWSYSSITNNWINLSTFPGVGSFKQAGFSVGNNIYIGLGLDSKLSVKTKEFWAYNTETEIWTQKSNFPHVTENAFGFSIDQKGYVIDNRLLYEYNPSLDTWILKEDLSDIMQQIYEENVVLGNYPLLPIAIGNSLYFLAGARSVQPYNNIYEYNFESNALLKVIHMPAPYRRYYATSFTVGSIGYLGTGRYNNNHVLNDFWAFDPSKIKR